MHTGRRRPRLQHGNFADQTLYALLQAPDVFSVLPLVAFKRVYYPLRGATLAAGFNSVLVVPLAGQREVLGALVLQRKTSGDFPPNSSVTLLRV